MSAADMPGDMTDGFHLVVDALKLNGVDTIFGVAGIPITDLLRLAQNEGIRYYGFRHEQAAGNAAAIAGFLTQKPGICMTVSAPGFLNGLVALANATTNCFPMVLISGSSDRAIVDLDRGVLVGATFVGPDVGELLQAATIAVVGEVPLDRLWHAVPAYPTLSEVWLRWLEAFGRPDAT